MISQVGPFAANIIGESQSRNGLTIVGAFRVFAVIFGVMLVIGFAKVVGL